MVTKGREKAEWSPYANNNTHYRNKYFNKMKYLDWRITKFIEYK